MMFINRNLTNKLRIFIFVNLLLILTISSLFAQTSNDSIPNDTLTGAVIRGGEYRWLVEPYQIKERFDFATDQVFFEMWRDSTFLGVERVISLADYFKFSAQQNLLSRKETGQKKQTQGEQAIDRMGLIPDVELPRIPLFGEGSRINISGSDRITFGGRQTLTSGFTQIADQPRLLPELKMEQALKVNLDGTIGERTKVLIDHDSEREQAGKNKIKLSYTGTEDDILQNLEFGDTRLVIPSTGYTGDLPARKGLFGVSGKAKLGGLDLYAVASREESQGETKEFRGQTRIVSDTIYDTEFLRRTFFYLGEPGNATISDLKVYINDGNVVSGESAIATVFFRYPESIPSYYPDDRDVGRYTLKVRGEDYTFHEDGNVIEFTKYAPLPGNWGIAVSYRVGNDTIGGRRILSNMDTVLVLKLIKTRRPDTLSRTWNYELKNIYYLGAKDVKIEDVKILRYQQGVDPNNYPEIETNGPASGQTFLKILGLDPDNNGIIEWPEFDASRGYIIFQEQFPFADTLLSMPDSIIYRKDALTADEGRKYLFAVNYSTAKGSFSLGQFDIEEGSEKVYVNSQLQTQEDYEINYVTGELKFKKALPPNADVKVTYEYRPLFSLANKSLLGTRGEWKFSENGKVGSSIFYRQEGIPETRATLGAEPFQRLIAESDVSYNYKPEFITNILQKIPLLHADAPSSFSFASEGAISLPNPNTRGLTYLDDFEKTTISQDVLLRGLVWQFSSVPADRDTPTFANERMFWYNPTTRIRKDSIFGTGIGEEGSETVDYLKVIYSPTDTSSWAGFMTCVSQSGWNLSEIENLEVILRTGQQFPHNGKIHFTIATRIDEDAPRRTKNGLIAGYNNRQDKEDANSNGILDEQLGEDVGLDTIQGIDAASVFGDDGNDDYNPTTNPIGTEGNKRLDDEDLDQNGFSRNNDYYEYTVTLGDSIFFTSLANNWKLMRIPLADSLILRDPTKFRSEGIPKWEDVRIVRVWFSDFSSVDTFDIYSLSFAGSRWRSARIVRPDTSTNWTPPVDSSEKITVASISNKTDPSYIPPFDLRRDQTTGRTEDEASLAVSYDSIISGHRGIVIKSNFEQEDYRDYEKIRIYVHNDVNDPNFIFRFGGDSLNYYEYKAKISSGISVPAREGWYEFEIILDTAVNVKYQKDTIRELTIGNYRVYGTPSLADIRYQALGIENITSDRISGGIWFDDIRLLNPRSEPGYGFQTNATLALSNFVSASFNFVYSDPNFRRFSEGRGVKTGGFGNNVGYTVRAALDKFFPTSWGLSVPVTYRRVTNRSLPKYSAYYSDYRLSKVAADSQKGFNSEEQWSLNNLSKSRSKNPILNYTLEAFSYSMGQRKTQSTTYSNMDTSYSQFGSLDYSIAPDLKITLFDNDIYLFPNSIRAGLDITDSRASRYTRQSRDTMFTPIRTDTLRAADVSLDVEYSPVDDMNLGYSYGSTRDLLVSGTDKIFNLNAGIETDNEENLNAEYDIDIGDILSPHVSYDGHYGEIHPKLQGVYGPLRNFENSASIELSTEFDLPAALGKIGDIGEGSGFSKAVNGLANLLQSVDLSYTKERNADFQSASERPPLAFRLGFTDNFEYDTVNFRAPQINRQTSDDISASTGAKISALSFNLRYGKSLDKDFYTYDVNANRSTVWPEVSVNLSSLEKFLFGLATSSQISSGYKLEQRQSGTILADTFRWEGQRQGLIKNFSPLFSWQTTWKPRLSTNFSMNYSQTKDDVFLSQGVTSAETKQTGANFGLTYTFSAPKGIPIPFLRSVRLPSDLSVSWNLRYNKSLSVNRDYQGQESETRNDRNLSTDIATSYRISNSIESGLNTGYSVYNDIQRGRATKNIDLNFWVLFKF